MSLETLIFLRHQNLQCRALKMTKSKSHFFLLFFLPMINLQNLVRWADIQRDIVWDVGTLTPRSSILFHLRARNSKKFSTQLLSNSAGF